MASRRELAAEIQRRKKPKPKPKKKPFKASAGIISDQETERLRKKGVPVYEVWPEGSKENEMDKKLTGKRP
jgi:hypothetical protein